MKESTKEVMMAMTDKAVENYGYKGWVHKGANIDNGGVFLCIAFRDEGTDEFSSFHFPSYMDDGKVLEGFSDIETYLYYHSN